MHTTILGSDKLGIPSKPRRPSNASLSGSLPSDTLHPLHPSSAAAAAAASAVGMPAPVPIKAILHDDPKRRPKGQTKPTNNMKPVGLFSHLSQYSGGWAREGERMAPPSGIHPAIVKFAVHSAEYENLGGSRRCREMLAAFKEVVRDYRANPEMAICRHLDLHLRPMIGSMIEARPLGIAMANAIRALRHNISILPVETAEHEAQAIISQFIDAFVANRLEIADQLIISHGLSKIADGDVIMTYARSTVVRDLLIAARQAGKHFKVIVVDSRPFQEGRRLLQELVAADVECTYIHINAVGYVIKEVTKTIIGAAGLYANGTVLSRVGTAVICALSRRSGVPVIVCSQTVKFSDRSQLDSFVFNEIGDPDALIRTDLAVRGAEGTLAGWRDIEPLKLLNILYDVTPAEYVTVVITEIGLIPVTSIPVVLREYSSSTANPSILSLKPSSTHNN